MGFLNTRVGRWVRDQFSSDENISGTPRAAMKDLERSLMAMTAGERQDRFNHVNSYTEVYFKGHHKMDIPADERQQLKAMEKRIERLNTVDHHRKIVESYGGPPTSRTIEESLERSRDQRERERVKEHAKTPSPGAVYEASKIVVREHGKTPDADHLVRTNAKRREHTADPGA